MNDSLVEWEYWLNVWPDHEIVYTRANQADAKPFALTPLSQDLILEYEQEAGRRFYTDLLGVLRRDEIRADMMSAFYGLIYLNADVIGELADATPGHSRQAAYEQLYGLERDPMFVPPKKSLSEKLKESRKAMRVFPRMLRLGKGLAARINREHERVLMARPAGALRALDDAALLSWWKRLDAISVDSWIPLMLGAGLSAAYFEIVRKMLASMASDSDGDLNNRLHVGLGGNESAESAHVVASLAGIARQDQAVRSALEGDDPENAARAANPQFAEALDAFLERFGYRGVFELELARPTWRQDPSSLLAAVAVEMRRQTEPSSTPAAVRAAAEAELRRRVRRVARPLLPSTLKRSRNLLALRENGKTPIIRLYDERRRLLERASALLVQRGALPDPEAICYLRHAEIDEVLSGASPPSAEEIERRRDAHKACLGVQIPDLLDVGPGWLRPVTESALTRMGLLPPPPADRDGARLHGIAAAPGVHTGVARVLHEPFDSPFDPGDVLFARSVDPGWAPILGSAGAVVLDTGGLLSHGAVVARELGIPCVVNTRFGTDLARSGARVTVDGSAGEVTLEGSTPDV